MKISLNWLKQYIELTETPEEISALLTGSGLEVEGLEEVETVPGGLKGMVIGEVLTCERHPNADKLSVTTVDIGTDEPSPIVCGAPNVAAGQKVVVATVGATLYPKGGDSFKPPRPDKIKLGDDPLGHKNSKNLSKRLAKENKAFLKMAEMFDTIVKEHTKQSKNEQKLTKNIDDILYQLSSVDNDESNDKGVIDEVTDLFKEIK